MQTLGLSPSTPKPTSRLHDLFWPDVSDEPGARTACRNAMWACLVIVALTSLFALIGILPKIAFLDAVLFLAIAGGLYKMSRVAAIAGFALYLIEVIVGMKIGVIPIIIIALLLNSVRATWGYQRALRQKLQQVQPDITPV